jgi:hypothetical protein
MLGWLGRKGSAGGAGGGAGGAAGAEFALKGRALGVFSSKASFVGSSSTSVGMTSGAFLAWRIGLSIRPYRRRPSYRSSG